MQNEFLIDVFIVLSFVGIILCSTGIMLEQRKKKKEDAHGPNGDENKGANK